MRDICIIIPTTASYARQAYLFEALKSLRNQEGGVRAIPIVVVNGRQFHQPLVDELKRDPNIRFLYREEGSAPHAVAAGREIVDTEFFGALDDDDVCFPNSLRVRIAAFESHPAADVVVANGYERFAHGERLITPDLLLAGSDPARYLMIYPWMHSAAALFKSETNGPDIFNDAPKMIEWTYIGLKLSLTKKIEFVNDATYAYRRGTPHELSTSRIYFVEQPVAMRRMLALDVPHEVRRLLRRKLASSLHQLATIELRDGNLIEAWRVHIASLCSLHGLRYASFTRRLLVSSVLSRYPMTEK